ncbi:U19-ctenitoxin-Pn1a-like isoform X1 [Littorina saxatilis]|uniref:Uncharacterized protein n=1 Tax=Littorina saxatilis TaxID=31220 RepID=A0AAN9FW18_9CAEN
MKLLIVFALLVLAWCGEACQTSADCGHGECCVSNMRPIGKRQLVSSRDGGTCKPRGKLDGGCLKRDETYDPTKIFFRCPCVDGLICKGMKIFDVPLGEMGTCVHA